MTNKLTFLAEIKQVQSRKTASLDNEVKLTVVTDDVRVMDLGKLPADSLIKVTVQTERETEPFHVESEN